MNTEEFMIKLNNQELLCPDCKSKLEMADMIMWDQYCSVESGAENEKNKRTSLD